MSFWLHGDYGKREGWALKLQVNHTGWMTVVAQADRPKSVRNSCVIERICSVFVSLHLCIVCRLRVFVIRLCQISSLFSKRLSLVKKNVLKNICHCLERYPTSIISICCINHCKIMPTSSMQHSQVSDLDLNVLVSLLLGSLRFITQLIYPIYDKINSCDIFYCRYHY